MKLGERISRLRRGLARMLRRRRQRPWTTRRGYFEVMESRQLLAADPLFMGAVYIEEDMGNDDEPNTFEISFEGGAPGTQLKRVVIDTDKPPQGLSPGDIVFDTEPGGLGVGQFHPFQVVALDTQDPNAAVQATVESGSSLLVLDFTNFQAGDRLVFSIDVDEVLFFPPELTDIDDINQWLDPIVSGVEFQGSRLHSYFTAPHYHDVEGVGEFRNVYDHMMEGTGLQLSPQDVRDMRTRTSGVAYPLEQVPLPVAISGTVFVDSNLNLQQEPHEPGLEGVTLELWQLQGSQYQSTGYTAVTDANGHYEFGFDLNLLPGTYQVRQLPPEGFFGVGAVAGLVDGQRVGTAVEGNPHVLTDIEIPLGDLKAVNYDFAKAPPAEISGFVYDDRNNDGVRDPGEQGIANVAMQVIPVDTIAAQSAVTVSTDASGFYQADGLAPGTYRVVQLEQPEGYFDGLNSAGLVDGRPSGFAVNPGDSIEQIELLGGSIGVEYNFGEIAPALIAGSVHLSDEFGDCFSSYAMPLEDVLVHLLDEQGNLVAETVTDVHGQYEFANLFPGLYSVIQFTPEGLITGGSRAGTIDGLPVGVAEGGAIRDILLNPGNEAVGYDFCERPPSSLSGFVYHDRNNDGVRDAGEEAIPGVLIELFDDHGAVIASTTTDAGGAYSFTGLSAGTYTVLQTQPDGWYDGLDTPGTIDGQVVGAVTQSDRIEQIDLLWGKDGIDYNFGELMGGSISGLVHEDPNQNGQFDAGEVVIEGVVIELYDGQDQLLQTATTAADGLYQFDDVEPGEYTIRQIQPAGYFPGSQSAGSHGGDDSVLNTISAVPVGSGQMLVEYNFSVLPPGTLSGFVFADVNQNLVFDPNEAPLAGVQIDLLSGSGQLLTSTLTDVHGHYEFTGLAPGQYSVREHQPDGYFPGGAIPGSHGGVTLTDNKIGEILVAPAEELVHYNFAELPPSTLSGFVFADSNENLVFDSSELPLAGVQIDLLQHGQMVTSTITDHDGRYEFAGLAPGEYSLKEHQPDGYFPGGSIPGSHGGVSLGDNKIGEILVTPAQELVQYNFAELPPSTLSGFVFVDSNENQTFDFNELPLSGVRIDLLELGQVVATTFTDDAGRYEFAGLARGEYSIKEHQPDGYFSGGSIPGSHGGVSLDGNKIGEILVTPAQELVQYNFAELPPSTLSGYVFADANQNLVFDPGEKPIAGVRIDLLDGDGGLLTTTRTSAGGRYEFTDLAPGQYAVFKIQPADYFPGSPQAGSHGGVVLGDDQIAEIHVMANQQLVDYNFGELPPSTLSGRVFQDGAPIFTVDGQPPADLWELRDGVYREGNPPIPGVVMELRHGITGDPIMADHALPGTYPEGPITVTTRADGFYEFAGLPPGTYAIYQIHPEDYVDGIDTPGSTGGIAINPHEEIDPQLIDRLSKDPKNDAIILIPVAPGQASKNNNFSEVLVMPLAPPPPEAEPAPLERVYDPVITFPAPVRPVVMDVPSFNPMHAPIYGGGAPVYTWHLSVVDGGMPRGEPWGAPSGAIHSAAMLSPTQWRNTQLLAGHWLLLEGHDKEDPKFQTFTFGTPDAIPVVGDWNGDGFDQIGVFYHGHWYLDLNGNGRWDPEDLWALLGDEGDLPITGDWDGDGKDDIGIFGPAWPGDARALKNEPGLPGASNSLRKRPKNIPPPGDQAPNDPRLMRLTSEGQPRADVIDHVFRFGIQGDIPVAGDWNGDGIKTIGVFRDGQWYLDVDGDGRWSEGDVVAYFGQLGDMPVVGDWNGNGIDQIGIYRDGKWILDIDNDRRLTAHDQVFQMGDAGDIPVVGDWNGDGIDQPGLYRPGQAALDSQAMRDDG